MSDENRRLSPDRLRAPPSDAELFRCNNAVTNQMGQTEIPALPIIRHPGAPAFQAPTIAVTGSTGTSTTIQTRRTAGKRATKIEFVRFDSVETIFKQNDHDDIVQRTKIKDEITR